MTTIKLRGDTAVNLATIDRVYAERELILDLTNRNFRVGDGITAWSGLVDWIQAASGSGLVVSLIQDQKTAGIDGGTFASGAWRTRDLNTVVVDDIGIALSSNQITLPVGNYLIFAMAPAHQVRRHALRMIDVNNQANVYGITSYLQNVSQEPVHNAMLFGMINAVGGNSFELQHRAEVSTALTVGLGLAAATQLSVPYETYANVLIMGL